jgi:ribose 5-phosphate isomerase B
MKIYLASDHAGFELKKDLIEFIKGLDFKNEVVDLGPDKFDKNDDYPDYMAPLAKKIQAEPEARGVIIGGSGEGEAMVANRFKGVRAAVFYGEVRPIQYIDMTMKESQDLYEVVKLARAHNDANILSIGARFASSAEAKMAVQLFLENKFTGEERHLRRIKKIDSLS